MIKNNSFIMSEFLFIIFFTLFARPLFCQNLDEFQLAHFTLEEGNSDLAHAQVIILGDPNHSDPEGPRTRMKLVNLLTQRENLSLDAPPRVPIYLLEQLDSTTSIPPNLIHKHPEYKSLLPGVILGGWNSANQQDMAIGELKKYLVLENKMVDIKVRLANLKSLQQRRKGPSEKVNNAIQGVQNERDSCQNDVLESVSNFYRLALGSRNEHMIGVMDKVLNGLPPQVRLFISSGSGHFDRKRILKWAGPEADVLAHLRAKNIPFVYLKTLPSSSEFESGQNLDYSKKLVEKDGVEYNPWDVVKNSLPQLVEQAQKHLSLMRELKTIENKIRPF